MKKIFLLAFLIGGSITTIFAQNSNPWPTSGNVGIGTNSPSLGLLHINGTGSDLLSFSAGASSVIQLNAYTNLDFRIIQRANAPMTFWTNTVERARITQSGYFGIGISSPASRLHVYGAGSSINGGNAYSFNGDGIVVQAATGSRSTVTGAQLEFVLPANTDGSNPWGQARIITVAGNGNSADATGKMIIGTRRSFNKLGTGAEWYYGNDIVIDGVGNVGIGTATPRETLSVNGNIRAQQIKVETANWPDYVFAPAYRLPLLREVRQYIDKNQHLPGMPSAAEIEKDGINVGEMNKLLAKKVEELTLYLIEKDKQYTELKARLDKLEQKLQK